MRAIPVAAVIGLIASMTTTAGAQDDDDALAWLAMTFTPYGSLPPLVNPGLGSRPAPGARPAQRFEFRYGRWAFEDDDSFNTFGVGGRFGSIGLVLGYEKCSGCDDGFIIGGLEYDAILATSPMGTGTSTGSFTVGIRPAFGIGVPTGDGEGTAMSLTVDLPLSLSMPVGTSSHVVPFIAPGLGLGRIASGGESETGARPAMAAGIGFFTSTGFAIHASWRKIILEDFPSTIGVGFSFGR